MATSFKALLLYIRNLVLQPLCSGARFCPIFHCSLLWHRISLPGLFGHSLNLENSVIKQSWNTWIVCRYCSQKGSMRSACLWGSPRGAPTRASPRLCWPTLGHQAQRRQAAIVHSQVPSSLCRNALLFLAVAVHVLVFHCLLQTIEYFFSVGFPGAA